MNELSTSRKVIARLIANFFSLALLLLPFAIFGTFWLANPASLKQLLAESKVYDTVSETVIDQTSQQFTAAMTNQVVLDDSSIERSLRAVFTPKVIEAKADSLIDDNYAWLEGKRSEPVTEITIKNQERLLIAELSKEAVRSVQQKPVCTFEQLKLYQAQLQANPLDVPCQIKGISNDELEQRARTVINSQINIKDEPQLEGLTLSGTRTPNQSLSQESKAAIQLLYWFLKHGFMMALSVLLLTGTLAAVTLKNKWRWLAWLKSPLLSVGIFLAVSSLVMTILLQTDWITLSFVSQSVKQSSAAIIQPLLNATALAATGYILTSMFVILTTRIRRVNATKTR